MRRALVAGIAAVVLAGAGAARGTVILSEVLFNEVGSTADGEWIEIYNNGPTAVDLSNYKIGDEETSGQTSTTEALFQFPAGATIAPGATQIVSGSASRFQTVYGFLPTYETTSTDALIPDMTIYSPWDPDGGVLNMSNSNDQAVLVGPADTIIDATSWGNTFAFNPAVDITGNQDGQSIERRNINTDTDTAADWTQGPAGATAAQRSTPFVAQTPEPASLSIVAGAGIFAFRRRRRQFMR